MGLIAAITAAVVVGGLTTTLVHAAIPNSTTGQISGCYRNNASLTVPKGNLRLIDTQGGDSCTGQETAIAWSSTGAMAADLTNADFTQGDLLYRNLNGANYTSASLTGIIGDGGDFQNSNFTNATLVGNITAGDYRGGNFTGTAFKYPVVDANFQGVDLRNANFTTYNTMGFVDANLKSVNFSGKTFANHLVISNSDLTSANFGNTVFTAVASDTYEFTSGTLLNSTNFTNATLRDAQFGGINMSTTILTGATWSNVGCPDGTNSDSHGNTCIGHLVP